MPSYRFGKHPAKNDYRTLNLRNYLTAKLPLPPAAYNVLSTVYKKLKTSDAAKLFPLDGNGKYGDCTIAALAHAITVFNGLTGVKKIWAEHEVIKLYLHLSGGVDSGLNVLDVMNYWRAHPVDKDKILAYVKIEPKNHTHIKQAIELFGGVYIGFQVQEKCQDDFDAGKPWTAGRLTDDGHAVYAVAYDEKHLTVLTWGSTQKGTWGWWDECVDEAYAILPPQAKKSDFKPGFDFNQLKSDLSKVANLL